MEMSVTEKKQKAVRVRHSKYIFVLLIILCQVFVAKAQVVDTLAAPIPPESRLDTILPPPDSLMALPDSLMALPDSLMAAKDSTSRPRRPKSALERPAFSAAKDSVIEDFSNGRRVIYYYGDVSVKYGKTEITADYMAYDLDHNIVYARGTKDYQNQWKGMPVMKDGKSEYKMDFSRPIMERYSIVIVKHGCCEMCVPILC